MFSHTPQDKEICQDLFNLGGQWRPVGIKKNTEYCEYPAVKAKQQNT